MIESCHGDKNLLKQSAILEGLKYDAFLKNLFKEGEDYKGLKKDLQEIVSINNLNDEELRSSGSKFSNKCMHVCKRILQVTEDLSLISGGVYSATSFIGALFIDSPLTAIASILGFVIGFIVNRLMRLLYDTVEFDAVKKDSEEIVLQLKSNAKILRMKN